MATDRKSVHEIIYDILCAKPRVTGGILLAGGMVAAAEMVLRLADNINAPFYALSIVGPIAMAIEIWRNSKRRTDAPSQLEMRKGSVDPSAGAVMSR